ncbi:molybdenum cofactor guanylyltransferase [Phormidesmis sp. 146-35]
MKLIETNLENSILEPTLSAIVLAGGKSSRMGHDKALIKVDGVPLLQRVCEAALHCTSQVYVVTAWSDRYRSIVPPTTQFIAEVNPRSPLTGFAQALPQMQTEWILLLACDLPRLRGDVLYQESQQLANISTAAIARLPKGTKGWEPLCGFYRQECFAHLQTFIAAGGRSFQQWLSQHVVEEWKLDHPEMLFNCNTPKDLELIN